MVAIGIRSLVGSRSIAFICMLSVCLFLLQSSHRIHANGSETTMSKEDAGALKKALDRSWYSADEGRAQPVPPKPRDSIDASDRMDSIEAQQNWSNSGATSTFWTSLADFLRTLFSFWGYFVLIGVIACLAILFFVFMRGSGRFRSFNAKRLNDRDNAERDQAKVTDLPFEIEQSTLGLLAQAERFRSQGEYSKAMVYLFSHVLVELDAHGLIRLERGKTNRTYLRELRSHDPERKFTSYLVRWFEHVFFGKNEMDRDAFEKIWSQIPLFEKQLKTSTEKVGLEI